MKPNEKPPEKETPRNETATKETPKKEMTEKESPTDVIDVDFAVPLVKWMESYSLIEFFDFPSILSTE